MTATTGAGIPIWGVDNASSPLSLDARVLEDYSGGIQVSALTNSTAPGTTLTTTYQSQGIAFANSAGAPLSRGQKCSFPNSQSATPCNLTNGKLDQPALPIPGGKNTCAGTANCPPPPEKVVVDLGSARDIGLVVVRGCTTACTVSSSTDGATWANVGTPSSSYSAIAVNPSTRARYVAVEASLSSLVQISVWGPGPPVATTAPSSSNAGIGGAFHQLTSSSGLLATLLTALGLALLVALGVIVYLVRRKPKTQVGGPPQWPT